MVHSNGALGQEMYDGIFFLLKSVKLVDLISFQQSDIPKFVSKDQKCYKVRARDVISSDSVDKFNAQAW